MLQLRDIAQFLDELFETARVPDDAVGVVRFSECPVQRLGLALQPWPGVGKWARDAQLDALFMHRALRLDLALLDSDVGVLSYHRAFDEHLTLAYNPWLADELSMTDLDVLGRKEGRPIGMVGTVAEWTLSHWPQRLEAVFGGLDEVVLATKPTGTRLAVVGAMNDALVREAAARDVGVYVTGQWRYPAAPAVAATGIGVAVVGHRRSEEWGLRMLGRILNERWPRLGIVLQS
jgi:putative NIF3 family GTP cyclohydrolase 1 type 2